MEEEDGKLGASMNGDGMVEGGGRLMLLMVDTLVWKHALRMDGRWCRVLAASACSIGERGQA